MTRDQMITTLVLRGWFPVWDTLSFGHPRCVPMLATVHSVEAHRTNYIYVDTSNTRIRCVQRCMTQHDMKHVRIGSSARWNNISNKLLRYTMWVEL